MTVLSNPRHERFAQELAKGKTADEAYQLAGYQENRFNASRLKTNEHIKARVAELQARATEGVVLTKQWVLERLIENAERAMQRQSVETEGGEIVEYRYEGSVANRALELLGKEVGMFIDRKEVRTGALDEINQDELDRLRAELAAERLRRAGTAGRTEGQGKPH